MKKLIYLMVVIVILGLLVSGCSIPLKPVVPSSEEIELDSKDKPSGCTTIQDGILTYSIGHYLYGTPLIVGYNPYGYNYQAHMFNGSYANSYLGTDGFPPYEGDDEAYLAEYPDAELEWYWPYRNDQLIMKWNDAWISNKDCDNDGSLDRHFGYDSYIGSGAWLTNEQRGVVDGKTWTYFIKIVAKPTAECTCPEPGYEIWGDFCVIQEVNGGYPPLNEPYGGNGAVLLVNPAGFGAW